MPASSSSSSRDIKYCIVDDDIEDNENTGFNSKDDNDTEDNKIIIRSKQSIDIDNDISNNNHIINNNIKDNNDKNDIDIDENSSIIKRLMMLFQLSLPCCMSFLLSMMGGLINMMFAGHW